MLISKMTIYPCGGVRISRDRDDRESYPMGYSIIINRNHETNKVTAIIRYNSCAQLAKYPEEKADKVLTDEEAYDVIVNAVREAHKRVVFLADEAYKPFYKHHNRRGAERFGK